MANPSLPKQAAYLLLVVDGNVDPQLPAAWQDAQTHWDELEAHDRLLALARQHDAYIWLATRYRKLADRGDAMAKQRLQVVQRVVELSIMCRLAPPQEVTSYRSLTRMMMMLALLFAIGFVFVKQTVRSHASGVTPSSHRQSQRGSAMLVVLIVIAALLSGMATLASLQNNSMRSASISRDAKASLHCAEAGLASARAATVANWPGWNAALAAGTEPTWFASVSHDVDGDGVSDFTLKLEDNNDEAGTNDGTKDNDLTVFVVSTCTKYSETPVQVAELVRYNGGGNCYQAQLGGCGGNNNAN